MRPSLLLPLVAAILTACSKENYATVEAVPDTAEAVAEDKPELPPLIVKLAEACLSSLPAAQKPADVAEARTEFVRSFFSGYTTHRGTVGLRSDAEKQGFKAGQEYRDANPDKAKEIFESYGYEATETEGVWSVRFEHSGFKPTGSAKEWWFSTLKDTVSDLPEGGIPEAGVSIRISGYLSPPGNHGHFGAYERAFFATKISKLGS